MVHHPMVSAVSKRILSFASQSKASLDYYPQLVGTKVTWTPRLPPLWSFILRSVFVSSPLFSLLSHKPPPRSSCLFLQWNDVLLSFPEAIVLGYFNEHTGESRCVRAQAARDEARTWENQWCYRTALRSAPSADLPSRSTTRVLATCQQRPSLPIAG